MKRSPRGYIVYGNKDGYVPNWSGLPLTLAADSTNLQHFPARWQSPLCLMAALNPVNCWKVQLDNQQPSFSRNGREGSETTDIPPKDNIINGDEICTKAGQIVINQSEDIVRTTR